MDHPLANKITPGLNMVLGALSDAGIPMSNAGTKLGNPTSDASPTSAFLAGWRSLPTLYPKTPINYPLLDDITRCMEVYERIRPVSSKQSRTYSFHMTVSGDPNELSLDMVPPKVIGGSAWTLNHEFEEIQNKWVDAGFPNINPCIAFGWPAVQRKVISSRKDINDCDAINLLTTVDYDLDRQDTYHSSFRNAIAIGKRYVPEIGTRMQSTALVAFLGLDVQVNVRTLQESWIAKGMVGGNLGPADVSPADWVATLIGDCGIFTACGYEDEEHYEKSRTGIFSAVVMGNIHDIVYDIVTSNRLSSGLYALAAGVSEFDLHCAFLATMADGIAHRLLSLGPEDVPLFGDNTLMITGPWVLYTERYRTWERFVKYLRILKRSKSPKAQDILRLARSQLVMTDVDIDDVDDAWTKAMTRSSEKNLTARTNNTVTYPVSAAPEMAHIPGLPIPELCASCKVGFEEAFSAFKDDSFYGIPGLPASVAACSAVARSAAIRRLSIYAADDACCDQCACKIGRWCDVAGYMVCGPLMENESTTGGAEWLLQNYAVWVVALSPISMMTVLTGFDLLSKVRCVDRSMGNRDVLENWETGIEKLEDDSAK